MHKAHVNDNNSSSITTDQTDWPDRLNDIKKKQLLIKFVEETMQDVLCLVCH